MQKGAGPSAAMDKANRDKMFPQGEGAVGKRQAYKIKTLMAIAWLEIQMPKKLCTLRKRKVHNGLQGTRSHLTLIRR